MLFNLIKQKHLIVSVIGAHAGEDVSVIFSRKQREVKNNGKTYWLIKSFKARTLNIQELCKKAKKENGDIYCLFIDSSSKNGARPTTHNSIVKYISDNGNEWKELSKDVLITGKIDKQSTALVLSELEISKEPIDFDLWQYSEFKTNNPIKLQLGASTICCQKASSEGMKSRYRKILAHGKLKAPYAVFVK